MQILNTSNRYGFIAKVFHWIMALLIIGLLCLGLYMTGLQIGIQKLKYYGWHKELGILALWLVVLRIGWRLRVPTSG